MITYDYIKDAQNRTIAVIQTNGLGDKTLKDAHGKILGYYYHSNDTTKDAHGRVLYKGDRLTLLIPR